MRQSTFFLINSFFENTAGIPPKISELIKYYGNSHYKKALHKKQDFFIKILNKLSANIRYIAYALER